MACLIKLPVEGCRGVLSFTTGEEAVLARESRLRDLYTSLRERFVTCLHYNHYLHAPGLEFDLHLGDEGDITPELFGRVRHAPLTACNFAGSYFSPAENIQKYWDILFIGRLIDYKGIPQFFDAIRDVYNKKKLLRVLMLCPSNDEVAARAAKKMFDAYFTSKEQEYFNLVFLRENFPYFFDRETLAFFYRSSRIFVQASAVERRGRVAGYAWSSGLPVVGGSNIAEGLPPELRHEPAFWSVNKDNSLSSRIIVAHVFSGLAQNRLDQRVIDHFSVRGSIPVFKNAIKEILKMESGSSLNDMNLSDLDMRLARNHDDKIAGLNLVGFMKHLLEIKPGDWFVNSLDPELELISESPSRSSDLNFAGSLGGVQKLKRLRSKILMAARLAWK